MRWETDEQTWESWLCLTKLYAAYLGLGMVVMGRLLD